MSLALVKSDLAEKTTPPAQNAGEGRTIAQSPTPLPETGVQKGTITFERLSKTYRAGGRDVEALKAIDLTIQPGRIFGIIGRSGAGKSSLLRTINRLESVSSGKVLVDGQDIAAFDKAGLVRFRRRVGMIFQHFNLLSAKTVFENIALPLTVAGQKGPEVAAKVRAVLKLVGLEGKENTYPSRLSGGQKQRVGIARALINDPEILLCDEATSALDPETTLSILALLKDINQRLGLTIVLITHEMSVIREICDDVLVLEAGEAVETGPVWHVFGNPRHSATQALLSPLKRGLPHEVEALLSHNIKAEQAQAALVQLSFSGQSQTLPDLAAIASAFGKTVQVLQSNIDFLKGRAIGTLIVQAGDLKAVNAAINQRDLADDIRILGYVATHA